MRAKQIRRFLLAGCLLLAAAVPAQAGWSLDQTSFHASAHGQFSCLECHQGKEEGHPDPGNVDRKPGEGFQAERCAECHDKVAGELAGKRHGGKEINDPARYADCLACHDPHRQPTLEMKAKLDPKVPLAKQCAVCHEAKTKLPAPREEEAKCFACHATPPGAAAGEKQRQEALCLYCHGKESDQGVMVFDPADLAKGPHAQNDCLACHRQADQGPHSAQPKVDCTACHAARHDEAKAGDLHLGVSCQACHLKGVEPFREKDGSLATRTAQGDLALVHQLVEDPRAGDSCRRCHHAGNQLGAAAMVLPPKGLLCLPCHAATFTLRDNFSRVGLAVFLLGVAGALGFWLSGRGGAAVAGGFLKALFSPRLGAILAAFVLDGLLQRRLWRFSPARGLIHALIFVPFLVRFVWGLVGLLASLWAPGADWGFAMLAKNHPLTAFFFDLTGGMVLLGVALAIRRRAQAPTLPGLPAPDWPALGLLLGIVLVGFVTEAARLALTGWPEGSGYAFLGYPLSRVIAGAWLTGAYGFLWYLHAALTAAFVAYLPFSRMFHILLAPVVLAVNAAEGHHGQGEHGEQ